MKFDEKTVEKIITAYSNYQSINAIAKDFYTYPTTIKRILERNNVELRHDVVKKGTLCVQDGEKLIEWAKAQGRLVTKAELAKIAGTKRLSPSYFIKYPELGQYIKTYEQDELQEYSQKLYDWLQKNDIKYKPNDRTKLKMSVTALLLEKYEGLAIEIDIKPQCISKKKYDTDTREKSHRAVINDIFIIWLNKDHFKNLDDVKGLLEVFKDSCK